MQVAATALLTFLSAASAASSGACCNEKKVGNIVYKLLEEDSTETVGFGCWDGCVYNTEDNAVDRFCFKAGNLEVTCRDWGYEGKYGPDNWYKGYPACAGRAQSPIDVPASPGTGVAVQTETTPLLFSNYENIRGLVLGNDEEHLTPAARRLRRAAPGGDRIEKGEVKNNGHTAQLDVTDLGDSVGVLSGGPLTGQYQILQLHFHWGANDSVGSEHLYDGRAYPLEMHIVHKKVGEPDFLSVPEGLAVTGFMFEVAAADNTALAPLVDALANIESPDTKFTMDGSVFKVSSLVDGVAPLNGAATTTYANYAGSLTTPGCMEIVNWINFMTPLKISSAQLAKFRSLDDAKGGDIVDNFRPPQPLNGRDVTFYQ